MKGYSGREVALGVQHMFAMFGATVLVPLITGLDVSVALLTAGIGTLFFHLVTKMKVPIFLGSSFAFIPGILAVVNTDGIAYAGGAIMIAGLVYVGFSALVYFVGADKIQKLLPATVVGPVVVLIGLSLVGNGINDIVGSNSEGTVNAWTEYPWLSLLVALATVITVLMLMLKGKGIFRVTPILMGVGVGYGICLILEVFGLDTIDFGAVENAAWFNLPYSTQGFLTLPKFSWSSILIIAPIAIVTFMEHMGDMKTASVVTGKDIYKDPGVHRTLIGDGVATMIAGFFGGPANTSYGENIAVLATTKNFSPRPIRIAAVIAIVLAFVGKFGAVLQTIPSPVLGGMSMLLFGIVACCGIMNMIESKVDLKNPKNLVVGALILSVGIGIELSSLGGSIVITDNFSLSSMFVATIVGILANILLPNDKPIVAKEILTIDNPVQDAVTTMDNMTISPDIATNMCTLSRSEVANKLLQDLNIAEQLVDNHTK
jgi:uracil permease